MAGQGVFSLVCPYCGAPLAVVDDGTSTCRSCRRRFIVRLGHLIPAALRAEGASTAEARQP
jgi:uncharacterized Zn finger protein (UPF0148 family)